jgi:hypothetical protein
MLDVALKFLADELDAYVALRASTTERVVHLTRVLSDDGKLALSSGLGLSLVNLEEERALKVQLPENELVGGQFVVREPRLKLNLMVLVAAYGSHEVALKDLARAITFFQSRPTFTRESTPTLDARIERLHVELQSMTLEQLNQIWSFVGAKQLPSAFYRVRMVALQDAAPRALRPPITKLSSEAALA